MEPLDLLIKIDWRTLQMLISMFIGSATSIIGWIIIDTIRERFK